MSNPAIAPGRRVALAAVAGAHGIRGELRLKLFAESIDSLRQQKRLLVGGREMTLRDVREGGKTVIARIEGVADRSAAEELRGSLIEIDREALPALEAGEYYHADLIGLTCVDDGGAVVGRVIAVENFGAGDLIEIERDGGKRHLMPFREPMAELKDGVIRVDPDYLA